MSEEDKAKLRELWDLGYRLLDYKKSRLLPDKVDDFLNKFEELFTKELND